MQVPLLREGQWRSSGAQPRVVFHLVSLSPSLCLSLSDTLPCPPSLCCYESVHLLEGWVAAQYRPMAVWSWSPGEALANGSRVGPELQIEPQILNSPQKPRETNPLCEEHWPDSSNNTAVETA